ncbi:hypothetical protein VC83_04737 [Pseudogymnoascus destructans]|uniref:Uncharacterized protein n=2 Tax=Pseudogymnoascus destructans TaxID=655981 RepID=L8FTJ5_PSED2|nr:uncharacterized protein VC83_04737 [Pseudogymnoascus destructans]ELR03808.1 hypothetical protein GMDG_01337 [Pseudogymnoascus destructans 20631-21]OAF57349.2 hypothetical protein VC83_04737 [Pseudogymnoascus destructans]
MRRSTSASKRARSPTESPQPDSISTKRQERQPPTSEPLSRDHSLTRDSQSEPPALPLGKMPTFLQLSEEETFQKFKELNWLERTRAADGRTTEDSKWARCDADLTAGRDRFGDIFVWKNNRVKLHVPDEMNDYINASPITMKSHRTPLQSKYIAMQGPKQSTTDHVWRMAWHELASPALIVMLTDDKGYPYFPSSASQTLPINTIDEFGDGFLGTVTCEGDAELSADGATEIRKLVMRVEGEQKEKVIWHLLYTQWPDFGIPAENETASLLNLIALSKEKNATPTNPKIVHCRAGVGRSGTFIALDHLLGELEAGAFPGDRGGGGGGAFEAFRRDDPVFDAVNSLRMQRPNMVQAVPQYRFIYEVLKRVWEDKYGRKLGEAGGRGRPRGSGAVPTAKVLRLVDAEDVFTE